MVIITMPERKVVCGYCERVLFNNPEEMTTEDHDKLIYALVKSEKKDGKGGHWLVPINICSKCYGEDKDKFIEEISDEEIDKYGYCKERRV